MSWFTKLRDSVESVASVAANVVLPGSSIVTSHVVSKGSQKQLVSPLGQVAQIGSSIYGAAEGNLANYGKAYDTVSGALPQGAKDLAGKALETGVSLYALGGAVTPASESPGNVQPNGTIQRRATYGTPRGTSTAGVSSFSGSNWVLILIAIAFALAYTKRG